MTIERCISHLDNSIRFTLHTSKRKTFEIIVRPDQQIVVRAPQSCSDAEIDDFVCKRAAWIDKQIRHFQQHPPAELPEAYLPGKQHLYLGKRHTLDIVYGFQPEIFCRDESLIILSKQPNCERTTKRLLEKWYRKQAEHIFWPQIQHCKQPFATHNLPMPTLTIRKLKRRWGSMSSFGEMTLNVDLVRAPMDCIDYVITHELCHMKYMNHSPAFYRLLTQMMPDWKERVACLEQLLG